MAAARGAREFSCQPPPVTSSSLIAAGREFVTVSGFFDMSKILVYPGSKWQMNNYRGVEGTKTRYQNPARQKCFFHKIVKRLYIKRGPFFF
jgi:hypothetical protein